MKVTIPDVDKAPWMELLVRAQAQNLSISTWFNAEVREALRRDDSVMPGVEKPRGKVVDILGH